MAEGNVILQDKGDVTRAEKLQININTRAGIMNKGDIFIKQGNLHMKGDVIERRSETVFHVEKGIITTCDEDQWYLKANELNVDMDRYATGNGVSFNMLGVPVFYTPYFLFPVKRQSGLLIPEPGYSTSEGFFITNTFFWAISDYKDMTITSDYRERIGHGTGIEYRYVNSSESSGQVYAKYWDVFNDYGARWDFRFQHQEEFAEDLSGRVDINLVSDGNYFYDLEKNLELRSKPYLDSNAFYVERWDTSSLYLASQYTINLVSTGTVTAPAPVTNAGTVQKLPELRYTIFEETLVGPFHFNFDGSMANFVTSATDTHGARVDFNPKLTAAFGGSGLSFSPQVGYRATFYDRSADTNEPTERQYVFAGLDVNARVSRVYGTDSEAGIGRIRHSIEPTISYGYVPNIDQKNIPQFDSTDSIVTMNTVTVSLVNRLTAHYKTSKDSQQFTTFDLLVFKLSQAYDLSAGPVHMRSDVIGDLYLKTPEMFSLTANGSYNTYDNTLSQYSVGAGFTSSIVSLNLTEQFLLNPKTHYRIGGGGLKLGKWTLGAQWWRDVENDMTTQEEYRLTYGSQCWGINIAFTTTPGETRYTAMFDLKGLGSGK